MASGLGISVSPSRVPVRANTQDRLKSIFSGATMVGGRMENYSDIAVQNNGVASNGSEARAPNQLSEPFRTPILASKAEQETPSSTFSSSISPNFVVRNLDEDPHTGLTPTSKSFTLKKPVDTASRLSNTIQLPSPPTSPQTPPEITRSRLPRRSKDDLSFTESSRKLQAASTGAQRPRRISIPSPLNLKPTELSDKAMPVALAPPAPITIPPNEFITVYSSTDKPIASAKSPGGAFASLFRWNTAPVEPGDRLQTPTTLSGSRSPMTPGSPSVSALEQELRDVSADLAFSIRREMDLEDVIARLQDEVARLGGDGKRHTRNRTSDYFSEKSLSPPLRASDDRDRKGHSRVSSVALEDIRMANEKVTQLEKEVLMLKHENLELMTLKRETERKLKEQKGRNDSKKVEELESSVEQLRQELIQKTQTIETLQQTIKRNKDNSDRATGVELKKMEERATGAESQREALQLALRQLRERQALEAKRASDRIRQLEGDKEKGPRQLPRTPERAVTGITQRTPDSANRSTRKNLEQTIVQLQSDLSKASREIAALSVSKTQLAGENTQLRDMQQRLQSRLGQMEASTSASTIGEASATASLSYAHRLAVEMSRVTDLHVKSLDKVRSATNANLPHLKNGNALSPLLQSAYDTSFSPKRQSWRQTIGDQATVRMMEDRIKELEGALQESSSEFGEVVRKMQIAQIEMIELAGERDEALRRERRLLNDSAKVEVINDETETDNF
jgi:hypothetical protein